MLLLVPSAYSKELGIEPSASIPPVQDPITFKLDPELHQASKPGVDNSLLSTEPSKRVREIVPHQKDGSYIDTLKLQYSPTLQNLSGMNINNEQQDEGQYAQEPATPASTTDIQQQAAGEKQDCDDTSCDEQQPARRPRTPLGARISDALTRQDREAAVDILEHERLLLNDEMNLLILAGRKNEAADVAFTLMERAGQDESLYEQAAPILMANARTFGVMSTFLAFESYTAINTEASSSGHALGRLKLDFSVHRETRTNVDHALLVDAPDEGGGEITLHQNGDNYVNTLKLQTSQSLNTQTGMSLNHHHQIGSRLKLETMLAYNQMDTENAALRIVGRSNHIAFVSSYSLDNANQWILGYGHYQYQSIDGQELGSGDLLTTTLSHELSEVHPALHSRITGTYNQFKAADQVLIGKTASLIPAGENNTAAFFMPQDVNEIAAYIGIGDATENNVPARSLEYRAEIGAFDNQSTGSGWRASAGLAGRVIGADRLHLFIRYDQSPNGQGFSSLEAGLAYLLFY